MGFLTGPTVPDFSLTETYWDNSGWIGFLAKTRVAKHAVGGRPSGTGANIWNERKIAVLPVGAQSIGALARGFDVLTALPSKTAAAPALIFTILHIHPHESFEMKRAGVQ